MDISVTATCAHCGATATNATSSAPALPAGWDYTTVSIPLDSWKYLTCPDCVLVVHADIDTKFPHT